MSRPIKGLRVLSNDMPDLFNRILGNEEYKIAIEETKGDKEKLKNVFLNVLADDYRWEFINSEIVLRGGMSFKAVNAKQNLQMELWKFVEKHKVGEVFGGRCICDFTTDFYSPDIIYYGYEKAKKFYNSMNCFPVPDFVIEFNDEDTEDNNRGIKFDKYAKSGVKEYWMVNESVNTIEQYNLLNGAFDFIGLFKSGKIESIEICGFEMEIGDIFED